MHDGGVDPKQRGAERTPRDVQRVYRALITRFRAGRMRRFADLLAPGTATRILDVGGTPFNWELLDARPRVTLLNLVLPGAQLPNHLTPLVGSGTRLPLRDGAFDIAFCNSVIEHVGPPDAQRALAEELRRVARALWVQTPARGFFFEPHWLTPILHYLPRRWQKRLLRNFSVWGWLVRPDAAQVARAVEGTRLLGYREFAALFPDCEIHRERFLGWTKAFVAVRPGLASATPSGASSAALPCGGPRGEGLRSRRGPPKRRTMRDGCVQRSRQAPLGAEESSAPGVRHGEVE